MHFVMIHRVNEMHETTLHNTSMSCFTASYFKHTSIYRMLPNSKSSSTFQTVVWHKKKKKLDLDEKDRGLQIRY